MIFSGSTVSLGSLYFTLISSSLFSSVPVRASSFSPL